VERPHQLARDDVERAEIAGGRAVVFAGVRAGDDQILEHPHRRAARIAERPDCTGTHVDAAVLTESRNRLTRAGVDRAKRPPRAEDDAAIRAVTALPVGDAAHGAAGGVDAVNRMRPDPFAACGIDSQKRGVGSHHIHHVVDDGRIEAERA
jgi:hypothetical protein